MTAIRSGRQRSRGVRDQRDRSPASRARCRAPASVAKVRSVVRRRRRRPATAGRRTSRRRWSTSLCADLPLIEDLQRRLAGAMPAVACHDAGPRRTVIDGRRRARAARATIAAISTAAAAASHPLFDGPSPARSSASSTELVVSTPNVIGTPVAAAAADRGRARRRTRCNRSAASRRGSGSRGRRPRRSGRSRPRAAPPTESRTRPARGRR